MKPVAKTKAKTGAIKTKASDTKHVTEKKHKSNVKDPKTNENQTTSGAGWIQDASLEASYMPLANQLKPGERELEFSVAMRHRSEGGQTYAELRGRALVHAQGNVMALAEASYVAPTKGEGDDAVMVSLMYPNLRIALQTLLEMAGHTPPLPESLQSAA